jgi:hypothetical protein
MIKKETINKQFVFLLDAGYSVNEALSVCNDLFNVEIPEHKYDKLCYCIMLLNEGWWPNWKDEDEDEDENEPKYWNFFRMMGGVSCYVTRYTHTFMNVPSALYLRTNDLALYAAKHLEQLYKEVYIK